jgi:hypothetical protein
MTQRSRSYHAFIRTAKSRFDLTQKQAQEMYRSWGSKYGGLVRASDIARHPIVAGRLARNSKLKEHERVAVSKGIPKTASEGSGGRTRKASAIQIRERLKSIKTIRDWEDSYDAWDDADIEFESSADYGEVA